MTINERIREMRKYRKMSQKELANKIGMSQNSISWSEKPGNNVAESTIKSICSVLNVNENYIRYGTEPKVSNQTFDIIQFVKDHGGSELEIEIMKAYFELDVRTRRHIIEHFKERLSPFFTKDENIELNSDSSTSEIKTAEEEYIKSRLDTAKKMASSALNTTEEGIGKNSNLA